MTKASLILSVGLGTVLLAGCMTSPNPASVGTTYECDRGTRLQVSYFQESALVRINGARAIPFKETPSNSGSIYENGARRLARDGNVVTWSTAARIAPETCRVVNTIN